MKDVEFWIDYGEWLGTPTGRPRKPSKSPYEKSKETPYDDLAEALTKHHPDREGVNKNPCTFNPTPIPHAAQVRMRSSAAMLMEHGDDVIWGRGK